MSYFEKIGNTISAKTREISQKAKAFSETSSLNNIIKAEQHKIDTNYKMMGKLYFEKYADCPADEFSESVSAVISSLKKISETQEQIDKIRKRNCCPNCGTAFKHDAVFCSKCGAKIKDEKPQPQKMKCPNCGNKLDDDALFCDNCGTKIDSELPLPDTYEITTEPVTAETAVSQQEEITQPEAETAAQTDPQPEEKAQEEPAAAETESHADENIQTEILKKCPSCGEVSDDPQALFCNSCGAKL